MNSVWPPSLSPPPGKICGRYNAAFARDDVVSFLSFSSFFFFFREFRNVYSWCTVLRLCETRRFQAAVYMYALNSNAFNKGSFPWPLSSCIVDNYSFTEGKRGCFLEKY